MKWARPLTQRHYRGGQYVHRLAAGLREIPCIRVPTLSTPRVRIVRVCALLEALCGASYDDDDYMITYDVTITALTRKDDKAVFSPLALQLTVQTITASAALLWCSLRTWFWKL